MRLATAVGICNKLLDRHHDKIFTAEEEVAVRCVVRFVTVVVKARGSIRDLANALEVDLNQIELFK